ncbi:Hypothetical predicted protein [Prunus dulcis]|uniref:Uncharacterized protein n=1 Tax=Prunus dulcis TaxID=3755 RepID=A0A5E4GEU2_PRUDU|nr:hypothetical protein L3X38_004723 [Prunus dulcis]VVA38377.1 Hypothetical predicted protein [Prunus dulcis]
MEDANWTRMRPGLAFRLPDLPELRFLAGSAMVAESDLAETSAPRGCFRVGWSNGEGKRGFGCVFFG